MMRRSLQRIGAGWVVLVICVALGLFLRARSDLVLYHPFLSLPSPQEAGAPGMKPILLTTSDVLKLTSWFQAPTDPDKPVLLFFMGDSGALSDRVGDFKPYLDAGYGMLLLGYRGFGGNPGLPSEKHLYRDARAAIDWLGAHGIPPNKVVLYGHSLGTGIAVEMALEYPVRALVLEAPYTSLPATVSLPLPFVRPEWLMNDDLYDNLSKIGRVTEPLLIIQGTRDEVIPVKQGETLYERATAPKLGRFIPGAGHNNLYEFGEAGIVMEFLRHPPEKEPAHAR